MSPSDIRTALAKRGAHLNPGLAASSAIQKAKTKNINIDSPIIEIFSQFNGFQQGALDPGSGIRIWPLEEILGQMEEGQQRVPFADFLMRSNDYTFDIEDAQAPIMLDEDEVVSENLIEFFQQIIAGHHDF